MSTRRAPYELGDPFQNQGGPERLVPRSTPGGQRIMKIFREEIAGMPFWQRARFRFELKFGHPLHSNALTRIIERALAWSDRVARRMRLKLGNPKEVSREKLRLDLRDAFSKSGITDQVLEDTYRKGVAQTPMSPEDAARWEEAFRRANENRAERREKALRDWAESSEAGVIDVDDDDFGSYAGEYLPRALRKNGDGPFSHQKSS